MPRAVFEHLIFKDDSDVPCLETFLTTSRFVLNCHLASCKIHREVAVCGVKPSVLKDRVI